MGEERGVNTRIKLRGSFNRRDEIATSVTLQQSCQGKNGSEGIGDVSQRKQVFITKWHFMLLKGRQARETSLMLQIVYKLYSDFGVEIKNKLCENQ